MTCREYEPLIALYVEGDIDGRDVEPHLAGCSACRELLEDLRVSQAALKELSAVDPAFLSAVRAGVLAKIDRRRRMAWPWVAAFAAASALIVVALTMPRQPAVIVKAPASSGGAAPLVRDRLPARPSVIAQAPPKPKRKRRRPPPEPLVVKMLTDDPDIVIIWLVDQPGD
jgi:hypothetical protein